MISFGKDIRVRKETDRGIVLSHKWVGYLRLPALGTLLVLVGADDVVHAGKPLAGVAWASVGLLLALFTVRSALWREEIRIDLDSREFQRKRGYVFGASSDIRPVDCLKGVELATGFSVGGRGTSFAADVNLVIEEEEPITFAQPETPDTAYELLEHYTKLLSIPALVWEDEREERQISVPWEKVRTFIEERKAKAQRARPET